MRVVADSHAIVWYGHDSPRLSGRAREILDEAVESDGVILSIVTLVELWYVTKTTRGVSQEELDAISEQVSSSPRMAFFPVDEAVAGKFTTIDRHLVRDPWDRFIVATALAFDLLLATADRRVPNSGLVETVWYHQSRDHPEPITCRTPDLLARCRISMARNTICVDRSSGMTGAKALVRSVRWHRNPRITHQRITHGVDGGGVLTMTRDVVQYARRFEQYCKDTREPCSPTDRMATRVHFPKLGATGTPRIAAALSASSS